MTSFSGGNTTQFPRAVTFPRQRKAALESRVRFATTLSRLNQAPKNFTVLSPSEWTSTASVVETSESIEPHDNNLKLNAIGYICSKIFLPEM